MYLLYYLKQDYDDVELVHIGLFHSEEAAIQHKEKLLTESAENKKYNDEQSRLHQKQMYDKMEEFAALIKNYLERNKRALKHKYFYGVDAIKYLSDHNYRSVVYGHQMRFLKQSKGFWDRDRFWSQYLDLNKVDSEPEFIDDYYPPYPTPKPIYHESYFEIEEIPIIGQ